MAEFINQGAFGFLEKPVNHQNLISLVTAGLREKQAREKILRISLLNRRAHQELTKISLKLDQYTRDPGILARVNHINMILNEVVELSMDMDKYYIGQLPKKAS